MQAEELYSLFPELREDVRHYGSTARMVVGAKEAKAIMG